MGDTRSICDEHEFDSFFRQHARKLKSYLYYKYGDEEAAEDVVQESFVRLWKNCAKVAFETAKSYLYKIAINLSISRKRAEKVRLGYETHPHSEMDVQSPEFVLLEKEYMEKVTKAISSLPDKQREVFLMNRVEKLPYPQIAELSGVSVKAIEKLMHKALLKLRKEIGDV